MCSSVEHTSVGGAIPLATSSRHAAVAAAVSLVLTHLEMREVNAFFSRWRSSAASDASDEDAGAPSPPPLVPAPPLAPAPPLVPAPPLDPSSGRGDAPSSAFSPSSSALSSGCASGGSLRFLRVAAENSSSPSALPAVAASKVTRTARPLPLACVSVARPRSLA